MTLKAKREAAHWYDMILTLTSILFSGNWGPPWIWQFTQNWMLGGFKQNKIYQEGRGQWAAYYTSPQSFIIMLSYSLVQQLLVLLLNFDWLVH